MISSRSCRFLPFLLAFFLFLTIPFSASSGIFDKYTVDRNKLPEAAQEMLAEFFPKGKIGMIKVDKHLLKRTDFDVRLTNGTTIEFSNKGKWTSVDCKKKALPDGLLPKTIARHIAKNYPDVNAVKVRKSSSAYFVGLSDGVSLKYSLLGQFKEVVEMDNE